MKEKGWGGGEEEKKSKSFNMQYAKEKKLMYSIPYIWYKVHQ
jgi:hypothetical protein